MSDWADFEPLEPQPKKKKPPALPAVPEIDFEPIRQVDLPPLSQEMLKIYDDPNAVLESMQAGIALSQLTGIDAQVASDNLEPLGEVLFDEILSAPAINKKLGQAIVDRWKAEQLTIRIGQTGNAARKALKSGNTKEYEKQVEKYEELTAQLPALEDKFDNYGPLGKVLGFGRRALTGAAGLIGQQAELIAGEREQKRLQEVTKEPSKYGPFLGTLYFQDPKSIEELKTFTQIGMQPLLGIGEVEAGSAFMDMVQAGVDPGIADRFAKGIGAVNNALEFAQFLTFVKMFPGADKVITKATSGLMRNILLGPALRSTALRLTAKLAQGATEELVTEIAQEAVTFYGENWAIAIQNATEGTALEGNKDFMDRVKTLIRDFLPGVLALGAIPIGMRAAKAVAKPTKTVAPVVAEAPKAAPAIKPEARRPQEITKLLSEAAKEIRAPAEEAMIIGEQTYSPQEVRAARTEARRLTVDQLSQEIAGTGKRAISKAFTAGIKAERATALQKKIAEETHKEALKMARIIKKAREPAIGIDYGYAEAMRAMASEIDPSFRTERTLYRREQLRLFIERHPEAAAKIPKSILDTAQKKALNELTAEDLRRTVYALNRLEKLGRKKRTLQLRAEKKVRQAEVSELVTEALEGRELIEVEGKGVETLKTEGRHHLLHGANVWFLRPQRIIDRIGGGKATFKGKNFESLWNRAQRITNEQITGRDERHAPGAAKMKELGINQKWLGKKVKIGDTSYLQGELLGLYAGSKNELSKIAILLGNNLTEDQLNAFVAKLPAEGKAWADWIIEEYETNRQRLQEAHISYTNRPFYTEENYTPLRYLDAVYGTMKEELGRELLEREGLRKAYVEKGFTISRMRKIPKKYRRQVNLNLTGLWFDQVAKQENYVRNAKDVRMLQYIVNDKNWTEAVRQKLGPAYVKEAQEWVNRTVDPNYYRSYDAANKISSGLRRNFAMAKLVFNASTVLKQAPSWALALADIGPRLVSVSLRAPFQAGMMLDRMHRLSPQMRHRAVIREMEELKVMDRTLYQRIQKEVGRYGMLPIYAMDKAIVTLVWNGQFEKSLAEGLSETEAAMEADNEVQRSQPAAAPKDLAQIFASGEGFNWLNMFGNQLNQIWNMISYDIPQRFVGGIRKGNAKQVTQAAIGVAGIMMSGSMIWMISNRRLPKDEDDLKEMLTEQFIASIPIVGRQIVQSMKGYETGGIPIIEEASKLFSAALGKGYWRKRLNRALEALSSVVGFPDIFFKRAYKAIKTGRAEELIGGKSKK